MDIDDAAANFTRAIKHCDNLVEVHRSVGTGAQGRRYKETSINRAIVVLAVAAWQALIEDLTTALLDLTPASAALPAPTLALLQGPIRNEIKKFATPNGENARRLMQSAGFDPYPHWKWAAGIGVGPTSSTPSQVNRRINEWLQVRHALAHGQAMPELEVLEAVRFKETISGGVPLRLVDAKSCVGFFKHVGRITGDGLALHVSVPAATWPS